MYSVFLRCASSRNINNFKINTLITCIMIIHMKICYTGSLYTGTDIIYIEVAYFNMPFMSLGQNFIISVSLGFTTIIIKIVCIFIIVLNILFVCKFIIVQNVLFYNYLHYCINAPFYYNCMNVLSSALYLIDFYVLHVLGTIFNGSSFIHLYGEEKSRRGRGSKILHLILSPLIYDKDYYYYY